MLAHLIDVSDAGGRPDPVKDFEVILGELESFGAGLERKPMILVASKMDAANPEKLAKLRRFAKRKRLPLYEISAVTGAGLNELKWAMANKLRESRDAAQVEEATIDLDEPAPARKPARSKKPAKTARRASSKTRPKKPARTAVKKSAKKAKPRAR